MNQEEFENLKCGDIIQCKNHPKIKGKSVEVGECMSLSDTDTLCGCPISEFNIVMKVEEKKAQKKTQAKS